MGERMQAADRRQASGGGGRREVQILAEVDQVILDVCGGDFLQRLGA